MGFTESVSLGGSTGLSEGLLLELANLPELGCESTTHGVPKYESFHSDGPATHYAQMRHVCPGGVGLGAVYAVCEMLASTMRAREAEDIGVVCLNCGGHFENVSDWIVVLGPIKRGRGGGKK